MAVITDNGKTPIALAGVMGGLDSEIAENTVFFWSLRSLIMGTLAVPAETLI